MRPSMVETLMETAFVWSRRGTCSRRKVGCVIADARGHIISSGYNGSLAGLPHCEPHTDHKPCLTSEHAERNAIYSAAYQGVALSGSHAYCTDAPCHGCARGFVQCGIKTITYGRDYRLTEGLAVASQAGLTVVRFTKFNDWSYDD